MILTETVAKIAEAIREKTGKSEKIAPVNFAEEIKSISAGGGESGGSNYIFYDQKRTILNIRYLWEQSSTIKFNFDGQYVIARTIEMLDNIKENGMEEYIIAVCIDPNLKFQTKPDEPLHTLLEGDPKTLKWIDEARITEEEYFNLNA